MNTLLNQKIISTEKNTSPKTIITALIVDDKKNDQEKIGTYLDKITGYHFIKRFAENGLEALEILKNLPANEQLDIIILDVEMPFMDGYEYCEQLRKEQYDPALLRFQKTPIFFLSNNLSEPWQRMKVYSVKGDQAIPKSEMEFLPQQISLHLELIKQNKEKATLLEEKQQYIDILDKELEIAREMLDSCLPDEIPVVKNATMAYSRIPAISVSGDLVNLKVYDKYNDIVRIFICDVSGHGLAAASIAEKVYKVLEKQKTGKYVINNQPGEALVEINHRLENQLKSYYFTAYMCFYNDITGSFVFARAAHPFIALIKNNKDIQFIKSPGKPIDGVALDRQFENVTIQLEPGDKILLYTDGLTEAENTEGQRIGSGKDTDSDEDLAIFKNWLLNNIDFSLSPQEICDLIEKKVYEFTGATALTDDLATIVLEYNPK